MSNGSFGTALSSTTQYVAAHPNQPAFNASLSQGGGSGLYSSITNITSGYTFNDKPYTTGSGHNGVLADGNYAITSFMGGLQGDISLIPIIYANPDSDSSMVGSLLESYYGGWRKTYGATTGDALDQYGVFNGITSGTTSLLTTKSITLTAGKTYGLFFNAKVANSYAANNATNASTSTQIAISVLNASSVSIANGTVTLTPPSKSSDDEPGSAWDYKYVQFTPSSTGNYTVNLAATGSGYNDFYIDNLGLYELKTTVAVSGSVVESTSNTSITGLTNLFAYLVNSSGVILSKSTVGTDGTFSFSDAPVSTANMVVSLSTESLSLGNAFTSTIAPDGYTVPNGATTASTALFATTTSNITGLQVALAKSSTVLPITLKSFSGVENAGQVNLNWQTVSEINFNKFSVERSSDGKDWNVIGEVNAKEGASFPRDYVFIDYSPLRSNLYRLKMIDLDGSFKTGNVISIVLTSTQEQVKLYPNPTSGYITLSNVKKGESIQIFNVLGNLIKVVPITSEQLTIDVSSLKSGVYFVKRISADKLKSYETIKFIKI
ncbi:MAG: hypothetical protein DI598_13245 [Pseudopedobacter saltans]|uniref:Secretion system C-terminal sorting domain-containing protein n=1 Tax=Pseudopedobacter saltans TaxID=151895 RepID=A0A2W5EN22_9SPHI|nr:MAG: hypothetical protein DI598_13245 [Pseudopedobacter saltans]